MAFLRRAERMLARETASPLPAIDHGMLVATLAAHQAESATARAAARRAPAAWPRRTDPLAEVLAVGPDWRRAVSAQRGSFNPRAAAAAVNLR